MALRPHAGWMRRKKWNNGTPIEKLPVKHIKPGRSLKRVLAISPAIIIIAAIIAAWYQPILQHPLALFDLACRKEPNALPIPVAGVKPGQLYDSFGAPRANHRLHKGIDIFARRGTPVSSATDGIVAFVGQNGLGGNVVFTVGPALNLLYYAHLDRFGDFRPGDIIHQGDVLGYVGDSGNARGTPCHLHFEFRTIRAGILNPYPLLCKRSRVSGCKRMWDSHKWPLRGRVNLAELFKARKVGRIVESVALATAEFKRR
jgi:peptidoglycan LD-endopeptidase LytH